jgi:hypothetical protein
VSASETPAPVAANLPLRSWFKGSGIDEFELDQKLSSLLCATSGREDVVVGFGISMDDDLELDSGSPTLRGGLLYSRVLRNLGPMRGSYFRLEKSLGRSCISCVRCDPKLLSHHGSDALLNPS